jgi:hypothetical protein
VSQERIDQVKPSAKREGAWLMTSGQITEVNRSTRARSASYGGQPSQGLPTVAHAGVSKRERRLVSRTFASWNLISGLLARLDGLRRAG